MTSLKSEMSLTTLKVLYSHNYIYRWKISIFFFSTDLFSLVVINITNTAPEKIKTELLCSLYSV